MRIALVALAGLRVCDAELLKLGLSFPGVKNRAATIESLPSLGLLTLASFIPARHEVAYFEIRDLSDIGQLAGFECIFISFLTATSSEAYRLADTLLARGHQVILGGLHVTLCPDEAAQHATTIVVGEGEPIIPQLISDLECGKLRPRYLAADFPPFDFAESRTPRFDLLEPGKYTRFTIQTQRGCPWRCEFCASSIHLTPRYKVKPVEKVIAEIRAIKALAPDPFIEFADDNTFCDRKHSRELMQALAKENISWFTESDISIADDSELLAMIAHAGCRQILIGLEAPSAKALDGVEQKANWKARRVDSYQEAIRRIQSHGISVNGCFVLGLDQQDEHCFDEVFDFVAESGLYDVQITYMTPFPGTPLYHKLSEEGRILIRENHDRCTLFDINFQPKQMTVEELRTGFHSLMARLYSPRETRKRTHAFLRQKS